MPAVLRSQATALITGAASGVGFATAKLCRDRGMHLALLDIDQETLHKTRQFLASMDGSLKTEAYVLDVGDRDAWADVARQVTATFGAVDLLMLNAGNAYKAQGQIDSTHLNPWTDVGYWKKTLDTNVYGPLNGVDAFLPLMRSSGKTTPMSIVVTGSKQGITNPPGGLNPAYNASKAAIKILTEHLAHDLRSDPSTKHISVHLLIPGWTYTGLSGNKGPTRDEDVQKPAGAWYPSQVAAELQRGLESDAFYILCPDNETDSALDQARMLWACEDILDSRPALSRWDPAWKDRASEWIQAEANKRRS